MKLFSASLAASAVALGLFATGTLVAKRLPLPSAASAAPQAASFVPLALIESMSALFVSAPRKAPPLPPGVWSPPDWLPSDGPVDPWVLTALDGEAAFAKGPRVRARSAIIADLDRGEVLWSNNADSRYPVASLTKLVSGLALVRESPNLNQTICVNKQHWPSRPGARSRFETGICHSGWDYMGAALVSSDNRGAYGMAPLAGLPMHAFVDRMHQTTAELGAPQASWSDPSGLEDDNLASARDMLKVVVAAAAHPTVSLVSTSPTWEIERRRGPQVLGSTNRLVRRYDTLSAKTGYTDTAGWCFATTVRTDDGRHLAAVVLGAPTKGARFGSARRMIEWASKQP